MLRDVKCDDSLTNKQKDELGKALDAHCGVPIEKIRNEGVNDLLNEDIIAPDCSLDRTL